MPLDDNTAESTDDITATATAPRPNNATTFGQRCSMTNSINNYMMHACTKEKEKYTE
jgi:hypothetical protein